MLAHANADARRRNMSSDDSGGRGTCAGISDRLRGDALYDIAPNAAWFARCTRLPKVTGRPVSGRSWPRPMLILVSMSNQFGYGLAAITAGALAFALPRAG